MNMDIVLGKNWEKLENIGKNWEMIFFYKSKSKTKRNGKTNESNKSAKSVVYDKYFPNGKIERAKIGALVPEMEAKIIDPETNPRDS